MSPPAVPSIEEDLKRLAVRPPRDFADRVVAHYSSVAGPAGDIYVAWTGAGVALADFASPGGEAAFAGRFRERFGRPIVKAARPLAGLVAAARSGRGRDLRYDLAGLTAFEAAVLEATLRIPVGEVRPYAWVAAAIGRPRAVRAVGSALGRNPVTVLIPCHRVIRSDGSIGNYGGGLARKEALLRAEGVDLEELGELGAAGVRYLGSATTGIVCLPSCHRARRIGAAHRRGFGDLAAARAAGYRPCRLCQPGPVPPA
jgi:O-6-methylguanine DNA methyltransferase